MTVMNIGVGRALIRFYVQNTTLATLLLSKSLAIRGIALRLIRAMSDDEYGLSPCPGASGQILVSPLRTDWTKGDGSGNCGVYRHQGWICLEDQKYCTRPCGENHPECPEGFTCREVPGAPATTPKGAATPQSNYCLK